MCLFEEPHVSVGSGAPVTDARPDETGAADTGPNGLPYRPCAGVVLVNREGRIFAGHRIDNAADAWQMPQGGIDAGERPEDAARRGGSWLDWFADEGVAVVDGQMIDAPLLAQARAILARAASAAPGAVQTTGAGDMFTASYVAHRAAGAEPATERIQRRAGRHGPRAGPRRPDRRPRTPDHPDPPGGHPMTSPDPVNP